jgi:hypothetical protein
MLVIHHRWLFLVRKTKRHLPRSLVRRRVEDGSFSEKSFIPTKTLILSFNTRTVDTSSTPSQYLGEFLDPKTSQRTTKNLSNVKVPKYC